MDDARDSISRANVHLRDSMMRMVTREIDGMFQKHAESHQVYYMLMKLFQSPSVDAPILKASKPLAYAMYETSNWNPAASLKMFQDVRAYLQNKYGYLAAATQHTASVQRVLEHIQRRASQAQPGSPAS